MIENKKKIEILSDKTLEEIITKHEKEYSELQGKAREKKAQLKTMYEQI
jgi:hypothetical protein